MKSTTLDDKTEKVGITLPISLVKQVDKVAGDVPRSTFDITGQVVKGLYLNMYHFFDPPKLSSSEA
jgi:hypothetical protein